MKKKIITTFCLIALVILPAVPSRADSLANRLSGKILLQVQEHGEAWYIEPTSLKRYYMKDGAVAYEMLRRFGLGITNSDLSKIPVGIEERFEDVDSDEDGLADKLEEGLKTNPFNFDTDDDGLKDGYEVLINNSNPLGAGYLSYSSSLVNRLKGRILLQIESRGEAWYINPDDGKRYYMKDGDAAYQIMRFLSLGITNQDLALIPAGGESMPLVESISPESASEYKYVTQKPTGWFKTGQEADMVLYATGFNESGGPTTLNHPGKVATDGTRLIVSDTWNNRVLIWNEIPTQNNQNPDLVLGQLNFNTNVARLGADGMNWPMGVATDGEKLLVGDAYNDRILIWNHFPTQNGQPADLVLGASDFDTWPKYTDWENEKDDRKRIDWPWAVWTDGEKVIITSTVDGTILIWNSFPTQNNQSADLVLGHRVGDDAIGTPRAITSDGNRLVIGDYNAECAFIWNEFPTRDGQPADLVLQTRRSEHEAPDGPMGLALNNGKLYATSGNHIFVWNTFPVDANQRQNVNLGVQRTRDEMLLAPDEMQLYPDTLASPYGVATAGNKLMVADYNNNRVLIFNEIPTESNVDADVVMGRPEIFHSRKSFGGAPIPFSDGEHLVLGVDGVGAFIYNHIPDENKAEADVVVGKMLGTTVVGGHTIIDGEKLIMVHREGSRVLIWNEIPQNDNELPDVILGSTINLDDWGKPGKGRTGLNAPQRAAIGGKALFVTDMENNRILVWNNVPTENQTPADFVLGQPNFDTTESRSLPTNPETLEGLDLYGIDHPYGMSSDGKHLAVIDSSHRVLIWDLPIIENNQRPDIILVGDTYQRNGPLLSEDPPVKWYHPSGVFILDNVLFVVDGSNSRVLIWNELPAESSDLPDIILGQPDFNSKYPSNSKSSFAVFPSYIFFDGSFLWVGEMKWSYRLLRFSVQ